MAQQFFMYREYPLVRVKDQLYYGNSYDPYVVMIECSHKTESETGISISDRLQLHEIATKETDPMKMMKQSAHRESLYDALCLAHTWLEREKKERESSPTHD